MSRSPHTPKLCHHKGTGQAYVTLEGRERYLGTYGSPEAQDAYDRLVAQWLVNGRQLISPDNLKPSTDFTVAELCVAFWHHAQQHYRHTDGKPTGELAPMKSALKVLRRTYGSFAVKDFGPLALKTTRQAMIVGGWTRRNVNRQVARIRQIFRWGVSSELVPGSVLTALEAVESLRRGRSAAGESPDGDDGTERRG